MLEEAAVRALDVAMLSACALTPSVCSPSQYCDAGLQPPLCFEARFLVLGSPTSATFVPIFQAWSTRSSSRC